MSRNMSPGPGTGVTGRKMRETGPCTPQCLPSHLLCTGSTSQAGLWLPDCHCPNPKSLRHQHFIFATPLFCLPLLLPFEDFLMARYWFGILRGPLVKRIMFCTVAHYTGPGRQRVMVHCDQAAKARVWADTWVIAGSQCYSLPWYLQWTPSGSRLLAPL